MTRTDVQNAVRHDVARHALLPLRIFLGVTFVYAGLDKLTDSAFLSATGSGSIGEMMRGVRDTSAIPALVDLTLKAPVGFAVFLAVAELLVGLATLAGLLTRIAAVGGALISLGLWLTVSWAVTPYYYGNDLIYMMAWTPLILAGAPYLSVDSLIGRAFGRSSPPSAPRPSLPSVLRSRRTA
ncbi:TQO small subunit DoxD [Streptomyces sp. RerS4]|uniref:TQO small subunit DoxD n=1 Tax=Streptomyces sp. RerS4 TaxID=2942449 RepID=UPI00201C042F|nr:TQO small subunit DoxD [Streptomyces sp. RerS4]UQX02601.1 DoxX family membrane protein [Streptomyces sp. RerS4]